MSAADVVIIGAGPSGTHTLLALLAQLPPSGGAPTRIAVLERDPQFFAGVAWGHRSGRASLTLSALTDFLPDDQRADFTSWLDAHRDTLTDLADPAWCRRHRADIAAGRWDHLCVPRRVYGEYLSDRAHSAIRDARSRGTADVTLITADVTAVADTAEGHRVTAVDPCGDVQVLDAAVVVVAVGSPPTRALPGADAKADVGAHLVRDAYDPTLDSTLARLRRDLTDRAAGDRRVLVVGGNASALEVVMAGRSVVEDLGVRVTVLTPSGRPRHWRTERAGERADLRALGALRAGASRGLAVTAAALHDAVATDLRDAVAAGTDAAAVPEIADAIPYFLPGLGDRDRACVATTYGPSMTTMLRHDSGDSIDALNAMVAAGTVAFESGRYVDARRDRGGVRVTVADDAGTRRELDHRFGVIIGAIGFEKVSTTRAPLLRNLLDTGRVRPTGSDAGIGVDARYRAAPGLFVVGPLLAGNAHPTMLIWHAESVRRISSIARSTAPEIVRDLCDSTPFRQLETAQRRGR